MFVRDGRTLPFVPVTLAAMGAIRVVCSTPRLAADGSESRRSYPHALATYMALLELANDNRADRVAVTQRELGERAQSSRSAVQAALGDLEEAGVLLVHARLHGGSRVENEYVLVEPSAAGGSATNDTPAREKSDPRPSERQLTQEENKKEDQNAREDVRNLVPSDFPDELRPHAREVMRVLKAVAEDHPAAKAVWPREVGLAVMAFPRRPLVATAHELAGWAVDPPRPIRDVAATYRTFLKRARDLAATERLSEDGTPATEPLSRPANVHPIRRPAKPTTGDLLRELDAADQSRHAHPLLAERGAHA